MIPTRPLTIGIDARELLGEPTGVGRYLGELLRRWTARSDAASRRLVLYSPESLPFLRTVPDPADVREVVAGSGRGTWWEQTHLRRAVRSDPPDVFFAGAYTAPLALGVPLAVTIHDLSFAARPEWFRPREGARRRLLTRQAARAADVVFTDSEFSRGEILARLSVAADRVRVIPPGVTRRPPGGARREPLVLFVGSIFNRRRLPTLITAFAAATATRPDATLVIAGADRSYPALDLAGLSAEAGVAARVDIKPYVSEAELESLYARAAVFVFLSEYEGFGLTPLEALSAGTPIVVLDTPIAREVYGDAAWYVAQDHDVRGATSAIRTLLEDPSSAAPMLAAAPGLLARYSWDTAAADTLAAIEGIVRR
jgi:glycosyltransferase involved in cell wall biosynthesis